MRRASPRPALAGADHTPGVPTPAPESKETVGVPLRRTIGAVSLPRRRPKGVGLPPITDINLYQNRIGDAGAEAFADALSSNKRLRTVHLSHNEITLTGFRALLQVVLSREARHIEQLWLDGNSFDINSRKMQPLMDQMRRQLDLNEKRGLRARGVKMDL